LLQFQESFIDIKAYNDAGKITFYLFINGQKAGKITGRQLPGGFLKVKKNTTKLTGDDIQSIITVYASLMALIVYHKPEPAAAAAEQRQERPKKANNGQERRQNSVTYLLKHSSSGPRIHPRGHHSSPAGVFTVRGHYRHYKNGRSVWIKPYKKGTGGPQSKTYKLN
jgi:hypothetical protein